MKRPAAKSFQDLIVWQKAHQFVLSAYRQSENFPKKETYGLISQLEEVSKLLDSYSNAILTSVVVEPVNL